MSKLLTGINKFLSNLVLYIVGSPEQLDVDFSKMILHPLHLSTFLANCGIRMHRGQRRENHFTKAFTDTGLNPGIL